MENAIRSLADLDQFALRKGDDTTVGKSRGNLLKNRNSGPIPSSSYSARDEPDT
jgi:hypothetical protein